MAIGSSITTGYIPRIPDPGEADYSAKLSALLQALVDAVEARVPSAGTDFQSDLTMNGNRVVDLLGTRFSVAPVDPGVGNSIFLSGSTPEWYLRDGSNNKIQLTANGFLNVQGSGSIGGDYPGSTASAFYTNSSGRFGFSSSPGVWADMEHGGVLIHNGSSSGYVRIAVPSGQSSNVTLTLPGTFGSARQLLEVDATGSMALTDHPLLSGTVAAGGTYRVTGHLQSSDGALLTGTLQATQTGSFAVLRSSRDILHTNTFRTVVSSVVALTGSSNSYFDMNTSSAIGIITPSSAETVGNLFPFTPKVGDRLVGWTVFGSKFSVGSAVMTGQMVRVSALFGSPGNIGGPSNSPAAIANWSFSSSSLNYTITSGEQYYLRVTTNGAGFYTFHAEFEWDRPTGSV